MNNTEKIIKTTGIVLAIAIIIIMISVVISLLGSFFFLFREPKYNKEYSVNGVVYDLKIEASSIVNIKNSDEFKIETSNRYIDVINDDGRLEIKEKKHFSFIKNSNVSITLYIPDNYSFRNVTIDQGAGVLNMDYINTDNLNLELGAGKANIEYLLVSKKASIEVGAGALIANNVDINSLDLEIGTGLGSINGNLKSNSEVKVGIGSLEMELTRDLALYQFKVKNGIGNVTINDKKASKDYGNGDIIVNIDNGVGNVSIKGYEADETE